MAGAVSPKPVGHCCFYIPRNRELLKPRMHFVPFRGGTERPAPDGHFLNFAHRFGHALISSWQPCQGEDHSGHHP